MRPVDVIMEAYDLLRMKEYQAAIRLIEIYYPVAGDLNKEKPLLEEATRLGFNIKPVLIEATKALNHCRKSFSEIEKDIIFLNDFYQCRYSGLKLFAPPTLTIMSLYLENAFPCFKIPHFPLSKNHRGMYTYYPSPDHVTSLFAGGNNDIANIVTSSSTLNMIKSQYSNKEMGWRIIDRENLDSKWDGGREWFLELMENKNELQKLIVKAKELGSFHQKIDPLLYFKKWESAFKYNNGTLDRKAVSIISKELSLKENIIKRVNELNLNEKKFSKNKRDINDLKNLPVGTISYNKATRNRYVTLKQECDGLKYFSKKESFTLTIKTKPLQVEVEMKPELKASSIVELPISLYTIEQLNFIKEACRVWSKGNYHKLIPTKIEDNSIFKYLLQ